MFHKDVKVKSNNQIKTSEKKGIIKEIVKQYPTISEDELKEIIKVKESEITLTKLITHDNTEVVAYFVDKIPYVFKIDKNERLIPTVYLLWRFPDILPKFFTHRSVFSKLVNGADLMLPGVIVEGEINLYTFKHIKKNELCCVCLDDNSVPIAVGQTALSGEDMYMSGMRGRCVQLWHIFKDNLWALGDMSIQVPFKEKLVVKQGEKSEQANAVKGECEKSDQNAELLEKLNLDENASAITDDQKLENDGDEDVTENKQEGACAIEENEKRVFDDELLRTVFCCALKFKHKEYKLPVIVSTFMKVMQSCCPPDVNFDLKQTRYKKISVFLKEMEQYGCVHTKELQKGVLSITNVNKEHEFIKFLKKPDWMKDANKEEDLVNNYIMDVIDMHRIDGNTENFFRKQYRKNDILNSQEVRQYIMNYIKEGNLQLPNNKKMLKLDDLLRSAFKIPKTNDDTITFEDLFGFVFAKLAPMHYVVRKYSDNKEREPPILNKGKFKPIEFKLESRGGNKKVTAIHNLDVLLVDVKELHQKIRNEIGCSANIETSPSNETVLYVQGNQINQISQILKRDYGVQFKHIAGLDMGIKE